MTKRRKRTQIRRFPNDGGRTGLKLTESEWITLRLWAMRREYPPCYEELKCELLYEPGTLLDMVSILAVRWGLQKICEATALWAERNVHKFGLTNPEIERFPHDQI